MLFALHVKALLKDEWPTTFSNHLISPTLPDLPRLALLPHTSHPHLRAHALSPSSVSKSVKQSSEPLVVMRISPFRVKIMDLSSMLIIQPTTSPACQQRPNKRLPMFRQWPYAQYMYRRKIKHSGVDCSIYTTKNVHLKSFILSFSLPEISCIFSWSKIISSDSRTSSIKYLN